MGSSLYSRIRGEEDKPLLFLLHGLFGSSDNLGGIASILAKDFQTHALDLRNHGRSIQSSEMSYEIMAEDVKNHIQGVLSLSPEQERDVFILGHSMGGKTAMKLALTYPDVIDKIIIGDIAPVEYPPHHDAILLGLEALSEQTYKTRAQADALLAKYVSEQGVRQFLMKNLAYNAERKLELTLNIKAIRENYHNIMAGQDGSDLLYEGDVLFIGGGNSDYIRPEHQGTINRLFPNAQFKLIPDTSHWLHAEKPEVFASICRRFLQAES